VLRLRPRLRCALRDGGDGEVVLIGGRRSHTFPAEVRPALTELLAVGELKVADLPGLDPADRIALARRLVTDAITTPAEAASPGGGGQGLHPDVHDGGRGDDRGSG
jgi:hypothetical protein